MYLKRFQLPPYVKVPRVLCPWVLEYIMKSVGEDTNERTIQRRILLYPLHKILMFNLTLDRKHSSWITYSKFRVSSQIYPFHLECFCKIAYCHHVSRNSAALQIAILLPPLVRKKSAIITFSKCSPIPMSWENLTNIACASAMIVKNINPDHLCLLRGYVQHQQANTMVTRWHNQGTNVMNVYVYIGNCPMKKGNAG